MSILGPWTSQKSCGSLFFPLSLFDSVMGQLHLRVLVVDVRERYSLEDILGKESSLYAMAEQFKWILSTILP
uniref:Uncharacterized protein n=1 Tax=Metallosphaera hakonensis JCM 8857 = DSM 7519 TaxID=1293036 RepID=A0A2U9IVT6_9CREN